MALCDLQEELIEVFCVDDGIWHVQELANWEVSPNGEDPRLPLRSLGVEHCPLFGFEIDAIHRTKGIEVDWLSIEEHNERDPTTAAHELRVVLWTEVCEHFQCLVPIDSIINVNGTQSRAPPIVHRVNFEDDRHVPLGAHFGIYEAVQGCQFLDIWLAKDGEWDGTKLHGRFQVESNVDTLLVKLPWVGVTAGIGRELAGLDALRTVPVRCDQGRLMTPWRVKSSTMSIFQELTTRASRYDRMLYTSPARLTPVSTSFAPRWDA